MKLQTLTGCMVVLLLLLLGSCENAPRVFSLESLSSYISNNKDLQTVQFVKAPELKGRWMGLGHEVEVEFFNFLPDTAFFVKIYDSLKEEKGTDTSRFYIAVLNIYGRKYLEVLSMGSNPGEHDFSPAISTYYKVSRMNNDSIILQRFSSKTAINFMQKNNYKYFVPSDDKGNNNPRVYITESPARLAELIKKFSSVPDVYETADTLIKLK